MSLEIAGNPAMCVCCCVYDKGNGEGPVCLVQHTPIKEISRCKDGTLIPISKVQEMIEAERNKTASVAAGITFDEFVCPH